MDADGERAGSVRPRQRKWAAEALDGKMAAEAGGQAGGPPASAPGAWPADWEYDSDVVQTDDDVRREMQRLIEMVDQFRAEVRCTGGCGRV